MTTVSKLRDPTLRAALILIGTIAVLTAASQGSGRFLNIATVFSVMQLFATLGLVALGLGLSMLIREFDISVAGMVSVAGCVGVMTGVDNPWLGVLFGVATGLAGGLVPGLIIVWLRLSSVGVTLGGLLTFGGIAHMLTRNRSIPYANIDVALAVNDPILGILSLRSAVALAVFVVAALVISHTRIGRDVIATGGDRGASLIAGVNVDRITVCVFTGSGGVAALTGVLVSYSLAAASPVGLADVLVPGTAAAIIGGVSLSGGRGRPMGILAGVLVLGVLRSGLNALGVSPYIHEIATGAVLLSVAILDGSALGRRVTEWRLGLTGKGLRHGRASPDV